MPFPLVDDRRRSFFIRSPEFIESQEVKETSPLGEPAVHRDILEPHRRNYLLGIYFFSAFSSAAARPYYPGLRPVVLKANEND